MLRLVLLHAFLLALPFLVYVGYVYAVKKGEARGIDWENAPWVNLLIAGVALVVVAMVLLGVTASKDKEGTYVPAHVEDGEMIPGRVVRPESVPDPD